MSAVSKSLVFRYKTTPLLCIMRGCFVWGLFFISSRLYSWGPTIPVVSHLRDFAPLLWEKLFKQICGIKPVYWCDSWRGFFALLISMRSSALPQHMQSKQSFLLELLKLTMHFLIIIFKRSIEQLLIFVTFISAKISSFLHTVENLLFCYWLSLQLCLEFCAQTNP